MPIFEGEEKTYETIEADVDSAERFDGPSNHHVWTKTQKAQYDAMHWRGRTLYDRLRTDMGYEHNLAFAVAYLAYGEHNV